MSLLRAASATSRALSRTTAPIARQQARGLHIENTINNNFPFKYQKKSTFIAKIVAFLGGSFMVPFAAVQYKKPKQ